MFLMNERWLCKLNLEENIARTKMKSMYGCLIWLLILFVSPVIIGAISFYYITEKKESTLVVSHSPNNLHTVTAVEVGEPFFFGASSVRLKYNDTDFETEIANDGKSLDQSNIEVDWENDISATIVLHGEEQTPEVIAFHAMENETNPFTVKHIEVGYLPTSSKYDPSGDFTIQIRKVSYSKGSKQPYNLEAPVRVYYGRKNSELEQYKEWKIENLSIWDEFTLYWNTDYVLIDLLGENDNGTKYVKDSLQIPFNE